MDRIWELCFGLVHQKPPDREKEERWTESGKVERERESERETEVRERESEGGRAEDESREKDR